MNTSVKNRIHIEQGDITKFGGDALVNAANSSLRCLVGAASMGQFIGQRGQS